MAVLTAMSLPHETIALEANLPSGKNSTNIETRLNQIANILHQRTQELKDDLPNIQDYRDEMEVAGGWVKGPRRGFANVSGGGGFLNRGGWSDRGGFLNRRY